MNGDIVAVQLLPFERIVPVMPPVECAQFFSPNKNPQFQQSKTATDQDPDRSEILEDAPPSAENQVLSNNEKQFFGRVVSIVRKIHPRVCAGALKKAPNNLGFDQAFLLSPVDHRIPRLIISGDDVPKAVRQTSNQYNDMIFIAEIVDWPDVRFARGRLKRELGKAGDLSTESDAILWSIGVDPAKITDFGEEAMRCLPPANWQIPDQEIEYRLDLRNTCVFTCDPATARDLDDAISCDLLPCGVYEVGVHIADVAFFVSEGSALDAVAKQRATSIYLCERMVPMLPERLSADLCSLNPGVDRLCFSVVWHFDAAGNILSEWMGRSVIKSCAKLNYEMAQELVDGKEIQELPEIFGNFTISQIVERLKFLANITETLKQKRIAQGAVSLHQIKLRFSLDDETKEPLGFATYLRKGSHSLIEELMLLANMAVAKKLHGRFPDLAVLRRHPAPQKTAAERLIEKMKKLGINIDMSTSGTLCASLRQLEGPARELAMNSVIRINQLALYFRADSSKNSEGDFLRHYALACDFYSHFTSPIRRYADVLVHRQLAYACYGVGSPGQPGDIDTQLRICNERKKLARTAGDESQRLYYAGLLRHCGAMYEKAIVVGVLDRAFDVLIISTGMIARVYVDMMAQCFASAMHVSEESNPKAKLSNEFLLHKKQEDNLCFKLFAPKNIAEAYESTRRSDELQTRYSCILEKTPKGIVVGVSVKPLTVVNVVIRHAPVRNDPLRWEVLLDPSYLV